MTEQDFVGAWQLVSMETVSSDGRRVNPFGRDPRGLILYSPDGYMSVVITRADRQPFAVGDILAGSDQELITAARGCISYAGTYEVAGDRVLHYVDASLFPNWIGGTQERFYRFEGNRLTLSTAPTAIGGIERRAVLVWERAHNNERD